MTTTNKSLNTPPDTLTVDDNPESHWHLYAMMMFPGNETLQKQYINLRKLEKIELPSSILEKNHQQLPSHAPAMGAKSLRRWEEYEEQSQKSNSMQKFAAYIENLISQVVNRPPMSASKDIEHSVANGILAGTCLMYFHALDSQDLKVASGRRASASKNIVMFVCDQHNLGRLPRKKRGPNVDKTDTYPTTTEIFASRNWNKYQRVAHLWAAYLQIKNDFSIAQGDKFWGDVNPSRAAILAQEYQRFVTDFFTGEKVGAVQRDAIQPIHVSSKGATSDLPAEAIKIPDEVLTAVNKWTPKYMPD